MNSRAIRAWHYTRLTDHEVDLLRRNGIQLSTLSVLRARLDAQVEARAFTAETAAALFAASPFHEQQEPRSNKFWMTSHPIAINDGGVAPLMAHWGGEGASMWMKDPALLGQVATLGAPRTTRSSSPSPRPTTPIPPAKPCSPPSAAGLAASRRNAPSASTPRALCRPTPSLRSTPRASPPSRRWGRDIHPASWMPASAGGRRSRARTTRPAAALSP